MKKLMAFAAVLSMTTVCWAGTGREATVDRMDHAGAVLHEIMSAPDRGIPEKVLVHAKCIGADEGRFHRQEHGKRSELRFWIDGVAESNIDLHRNPRSRQHGVELHMDTVVLVFFLDPRALDRFAVEENAVVIFDLADGADCFFDILDG
ncbi:MAG: hypothetical protein WCA21_08785 [Terracidiphilus sp.]